METVYNLRKVNFTNEVNKLGSAKEFCAVHNYNKSTVSLWLNGSRKISDRKARDIEVLLKKPEGWLDAANSPQDNYLTPQLAAVLVADLVAEVQKMGLSIHQLQERVLIETATSIFDAAACSTDQVSSVETKRFLNVAFATV